MVDTARVVAHRVSPAERAEYRRQIEQSADLKGVEQDLLRRAATGEADAAAVLADLYEYCSWALRVAPPQSQARGTSPREPLPFERCSGHGAPGELTALNLKSAGQSWRRTAAELGDTISQFIGDDSYPRLGSVQFRTRQQAAEELLRQGRYDTVLELSGHLPPLSQIDLVHGWRPALCALAPKCESEACRSRCPAGTDAASWRGLAPREQRVRLGQQAAILEAVRGGRFDALWKPVGEP